MSNISGNVSESFSDRRVGRTVGIPRRCWCGEEFVTKLLKLDGNPYQKFFCSTYAAMSRESNEKHVFKWMDEAILDELEIMVSKFQSLRQDVINSRLESEKIISEFETDLLERVKKAILDAKTWFKRLIVALFVIIIVVCINLNITGS